MRLDSLIISVPMAQILYEWGIKQVSCFYWSQEKLSSDLELFKNEVSQCMVPWKYSIGKPDNSLGQIHKMYSAFTSSEIGLMLPEYLFIKGVKYIISFSFKNSVWKYFYFDPDSGLQLCSKITGSEQDARAQLLIEILEKQYIDVSQTIIK